MARRCLLLVLLMAVSFNIAYGQFNSAALTFPDQPPLISTRRDSAPIMEVRTTTTPACADGTVDPFGINPPCIEDRDYNDIIKQRIALLLNQDRSLNEIVSNPDLKIILNDTLTPTIGPGSPTTRFGGSSETPVCAAREELIFPMRAKTPKGDWVFVVNQDNVKQALRVERCAQDGGNCDFGTSIRSESRPVCRQKYVYRRMLVLGSNAVGPEEVLMPSCCVCYMVRGFDIASRVGNSSFPDEPVESTAPVNTDQPITINEQPTFQPSDLFAGQPNPQPSGLVAGTPNAQPTGNPQPISFHTSQPSNNPNHHIHNNNNFQPIGQGARTSTVNRRNSFVPLPHANYPYNNRQNYHYQGRR